MAQFPHRELQYRKVVKILENCHQVYKWLISFSRCDLTKRQGRICAFIMQNLMVSGQKYCKIPYLKDFELCGVSRTKIRVELEALEEAKIITWDRENMYFGLCDNVREMNVAKLNNYDEKRVDELFEINDFFADKGE